MFGRISVRRPRCDKGRFVSSTSSSRSAESLAQQRLRQKGYIARRHRERKRFISSFVKAFVIKGEEKQHWLPASRDDSLLFECMNLLVKETYLVSNRSKLKSIKTIYFKGDPSKSKAALPRVRIYDADKPDGPSERVSAFPGWRFPSPIEAVEMDRVNQWLSSNEHLLKVTVTEAAQICFRMFSRYKKCSSKYLYAGYPANTNARAQNQDPSSVERTATQPEVISNSSIAAVGDELDVSNRPNNPNESPPVEGTREAFPQYAREIMKVAKNDILYRSLKLAVAHSCPIRFHVLCSVWMSEFSESKPLESWCGLQKDLFEFCRLTAQRKTDTSRYKEVKQSFTDQLTVYKMVRVSAKLPLYEEYSWSTQEVESP